jgi:formylglycine-generating enzyme required for sulfatase activity/tRNA A-37 threonylcarbamoyl transferase component Bud32
MTYWKPNQKLKNGKFTIQKTLGGGWFGVAYKAVENSTGKLLVIKTLNQKEQAKEDFDQLQTNFVNEALRLAQCNHPHIVKVQEMIQEDGLWGMVMEFIDGDDLARYVDQRGKLSEDEALHYINQVGEALEYVHERGFLHRDVKPNNIILRRDNKEAVLIDFGLARKYDAGLTGSMTSSKTEGYAPPEQYYRQGKFGPYTDVYALAATLYSLLTGEVPLPARFRRNIPLPPPKQYNSQISERVSDGIVKGMALSPEDRPQTVREWLELLMPNNLQVKIQIPTRKFEFQYAKIDEELKISRHRGQAEFFTEDLGNGVILEMVAIPGGTFMMGSPDGEGYHHETPQHQVTLQPFFMGKYTITQEQYEAVMGNNPSHFQGKKLPVERVNWHKAVEFCAKLSDKTEKKYQLPSEAQWEYACRAGTTTPFHFGQTITTDLANYNGNSTYFYAHALKGEYRKKTTSVGSFPPNAFGLHDMHGNVCEWCEDMYKDYINSPCNGSSWIELNENRLLRGGSWFLSPDNCRSAFRLYNTPVNAYDFGFRVVCGART